MLGRAIDTQLPRVIVLSTNPLVNPVTALRNDPKASLQLKIRLPTRFLFHKARLKFAEYPYGPPYPCL